MPRRAKNVGSSGPPLNKWGICNLKVSSLASTPPSFDEIRRFTGQHVPDIRIANDALGQPVTGHWGLPDPAKASGTDAEKGLAFAKAFADLHRRIVAFSALPVDQLDRIALQRRLDTIGLNRS